jgi:amino acid transporter
VFLVLLYAALAWVNLRGARQGTGFATAAAAIKFGALLVFVVMGALLMHGDNLAWPGWPSGERLGRGAIVAIFALAGMEVALGASGEVRDPARTIPRALIGAMAVIAVLYVVVQLVAQGVLGPALAQSRVPLADALAQGGRFGATFILLASLVSMTGRVEGDLLGSPRQLFAFGRAGLLPRAFAAVHPATRVPHVAIVAHSVVALALALTGSFAALALTSSVALIALYVMCCASAWMLDRRAGQAGVAATAVPLLGVLSLGWMITSATLKEVAAVAGVLIVAGVLYGLRRRSP